MPGSQWVATLVKVPMRMLPAAPARSGAAFWRSRCLCETICRHGGNDMADAGLGQAQLLRGTGKRGFFDRFFKNFIFFDVHLVYLPP